MSEAADVVRRFAEVAPAVFRRRFTADCCLNATWVAQQVLQIGTNLKPKALACRCSIINPKGVLLGQPTRDPASWRAAGGYAVRCGTGAKGWPGHAVLTVSGMLVDASAAQFNRPEHGIAINDILTAPAPGFPQPHTELVIEHLGSMLIYTFEPYELPKLPGFAGTALNIEVGEEICELMYGAA